MRKINLFLIVLITFSILIGISAPISAMSRTDIDITIAETAEYLLATVPNPQVGSVGGEWTVIGLARSGIDVSDSFFENYFATVERYVREADGVLHNVRITEYSRVILALTAAGFDPRNVAGFDLTLTLGDFERTIWQGINGPIFALLALDSLDYSVPINENAETQATRELFVGEILRRQLQDGGWNLTAGFDGPPAAHERGDADLTGMALQALAKYQDNSQVATAIERGLTFLSENQDSDGGFSGNFSAGSTAVESVAQVLVALAELGIPIDDSRFVKNGNTLLDNLLSFRMPNGSFRHSHDHGDENLLSTEQAFYALVAVQRLLDGRNSLYRMSDTIKRGKFIAEPIIGLPNKHADVWQVDIIHVGRTFDDIQTHSSRQAIEALAERGIINGRSETEFDPQATMTRAEFAAIITRGLGLPNRHITIFEDVQSNDWFATAVATAFYYEIIMGTSPTTFNPNGTITRQEAAVMVARAARLCGMDTTMTDGETLNILAQFGDSRAPAEWARDSLAFAYNVGILDDSEFYIQPEIPILRGEIAEMLWRLLARANLL